MARLGDPDWTPADGFPATTPVAQTAHVFAILERLDAHDRAKAAAGEPTLSGDRPVPDSGR